MQITENSPDLLIVDHHAVLGPVLAIVLIVGSLGIGFAAASDGEAWIGLAIGAMGVAAGGVAYWYMTERVQLVMDRIANSAEIRRRRLTGATSSMRFALTTVAKAELEGTLVTGMGKPRRLVIRILNGPEAELHPIDRNYSDYGNEAEMASAINTWLEATR